MSMVLDPPTETVPDASADAGTVEERLAVVCGHLNVLNAQLVALTAEAIASGEWQGTGVRSPQHWLVWQAGLAPWHAADIVRLAEATDTHPAILGRLAAGVVSCDQAAAAAKAPAYLDAQFADHAEVATVPQLRLMVSAATGPRPRRSDEPPAEPAGEPAEPAETLGHRFDETGRLHLRAELDADHGRLVERALTEARDALFHAGRRDVTWADALVDIARRCLDAAPHDRRERFRAHWFIDPTDPTPARWIDGIPVPAWLRDLLSCDGTITPVLLAGGRPVSVGRSVATIPDRTRRLVLHRDRTCRIPGCAETRWLDVHHLHHQADGGGHDLHNLIALCAHHHRLHHRGHLGIHGDAEQPDGLHITHADGNPLQPLRPTPPTGPPPHPTRPYTHPLGERLQRWALLYPDPPTEPADADPGQ